MADSDVADAEVPADGSISPDLSDLPVWGDAMPEDEDGEPPTDLAPWPEPEPVLAAAAPDGAGRLLAQIGFALAIACTAGALALPEDARASRLGLFAIGLSLLGAAALAAATVVSPARAGALVRPAAAWLATGTAQAVFVAGALAAVGPSRTIVGSGVVAAAALGVIVAVANASLRGPARDGAGAWTRVILLLASAAPLFAATLMNALSGQGFHLPNAVILGASGLALLLLGVHARGLVTSHGEDAWDAGAVVADAGEARGRRLPVPSVSLPSLSRPSRRAALIVGVAGVAGVALVYLGRLEAALIVAGLAFYGARIEGRLMAVLGHVRHGTASPAPDEPADDADVDDDLPKAA